MSYNTNKVSGCGIVAFLGSLTKIAIIAISLVKPSPILKDEGVFLW